MSATVATIGLVFVLPGIVIGASAWRAVRAWRNARGVRLVTCPETLEPAAVALDAGRAAFTAFIEGEPAMRLASCSRWETREHCDEPCLADVRANGPAAAVDSMASQWYADKSCTLCGNHIAARSLVHHPPALLGSDGVTREWSEVKPELLPTAFDTQRPVCWDCHVAEKFRREFPNLVVDRPTSSEANP